MAKKVFFSLLMITLVFFFSLNAQEILPKVLSFPKPLYPDEAKSAKATGKVEVSVIVDEKGNVVSAEAVSGHPLLRKASVEAAFNAKFETLYKTSALLTYNFTLFNITDNYFIPKTLDEFSDIRKEDEHFEAVLNLVENYRIAFGYNDSNFHAEMPLTRGDFVCFLYKTLEMLNQRGKLAGKDIKNIQLYKPHNPFKLKSVSELTIRNSSAPFSPFFQNLLEKYDIVFVDEGKTFAGRIPLTNNEVINYWKIVFGKDAVPVNFHLLKDDDKILTRGEFAIFLDESLQFLTYQILP